MRPETTSQTIPKDPALWLQATTRLLFPEFSRAGLYQVPIAFSGFA
jgi:hypothetical protein